jgi:hypothetical protein
MKQIVENVPFANIIPKAEVLKSKVAIIGGIVEDGDKPVKAWLQPRNYLDNFYRLFSVEGGIVSGDGWNPDYHPISYWLNEWKGDVTWFVFANEKELFKWLSE